MLYISISSNVLPDLLKCAITETASGVVAFKINNGSINRFSGLVWDSLADQLLLTDCVGMLTKWSAFTKQTVGKCRLEIPRSQGDRVGVGDNIHPLLSTCTWIHGQCKSLVVSVPKQAILQQYDVVRESKRTEFTGHTDMVVGCFSLLASSTKANDIYDYDAERVMVSASADNTIRIWDSLGRQERYQLQEPSNSEISCMIFAPNLRLFVTGNQDGSLRWWHPDNGALLHRQGHKNSVSCLCFTSVTSLHHSVEEHYLVSGSFDGGIGIWLFMDHGHTELSPLLHETLKAAHGTDSKRQPYEVLCVCFHKLSQLIISGGNDNKVRCWCASDRQERMILSGHEDAVTSVCVGPNDGFLFSGSDDGQIMIWDLGTERMRDGPRDNTQIPLFVIKGNVALRALIVIPTFPPLLASATADSIVKVWDFSQPRGSKYREGRSMKEVFDEFTSDQSESSLRPSFSQVSRQSHEFDHEGEGINMPFRVREVHEISVDDNASEPSCLGYLETPSPPMSDNEYEESIINVDVLIGMTSATVIRMSLPTKLSRGAL